MNSRNTFFVISIILLVFETAPQKLISSTDAAHGEFKYHVAVYQGENYKSGGALISEKHVLTIAHLFVNRIDPPYTRDIVIVTGITRLSEIGEKHKPKYVTIHPYYIPSNARSPARNDIAVITLLNPAKTNAFQAPIDLPSGGIRFNESVKAIVSGWGYAKNQTIPDILQKSDVTIIHQVKCRFYRKILSRHLCGFDGVNTGTCRGDSGGALTYKNEIVGLVSYGADNCRVVYPNVYTRVSYLSSIS